jgi:transcriptional regulator with XRE-family HTH domain
MNVIGDLLYYYRNIHGITQRELVEVLSEYANYFTALNTVTLSRWETGTTSPSIKKKRALLQFFTAQGCFREGECYQILRSRYEALSDVLGDVFTKNYQYLIGNLPRWNMDECTIQALRDMPHKKDYIEHIIDIEKATNPAHYYEITPKTFNKWVEHTSSFCIAHECKSQYLGHFMMFKIKNYVAEEIAHHRRSEFSLQERDFCTDDESGTCYVHALYGRSPEIAALLNAQAYLYLLEHMEYIDNVMIFSTRSDGLLLSKDYGIKVVGSGKDDTCGFDWCGMLSPLEDILFSDTVLKLVF